MPSVPKFIYRLNLVPAKIQVRLFLEISKMVIKFIWKDTLFFKEHNLRIIILDLKIYPEVSVVKAVWCWWKSRLINHRNSSKSLKIEPYLFSTYFWRGFRKKQSIWNTCLSLYKIMNIDHSQIQKINGSDIKTKVKTEKYLFWGWFKYIF
jgi:hypothetical protein